MDFKINNLDYVCTENKDSWSCDKKKKNIENFRNCEELMWNNNERIEGNVRIVAHLTNGQSHNTGCIYRKHYYPCDNTYSNAAAAQGLKIEPTISGDLCYFENAPPGYDPWKCNYINDIKKPGRKCTWGDGSNEYEPHSTVTPTRERLFCRYRDDVYEPYNGKCYYNGILLSQFQVYDVPSSTIPTENRPKYCEYPNDTLSGTTCQPLNGLPSYPADRLTPRTYPRPGSSQVSGGDGGGGDGGVSGGFRGWGGGGGGGGDTTATTSSGDTTATTSSGDSYAAAGGSPSGPTPSQEWVPGISNTVIIGGAVFILLIIILKK